MELLTNLGWLGWNGDFQHQWEQMDVADTRPARVVADFGTSLKILMPEPHSAELSGKLAHYSRREDTPKVGDWVAVRLSANGHAVIEAVVPRHSDIARKVAGRQAQKQTIAANVDVAFVLLALDDDFSLARLKRFLYQLSISNVKPVIVLNKADKTNDPASFVSQLRALELPIIVTTATTGAGVDEMLAFIHPGQTAILLGSSGVGKSTLTNQLLGREAQKTHAVRESDSTGMHTTVHRELFVLADGGLLIDTPGIRELQLWGTQEDLDENFDDVAALISQCKYTTCRHGSELGCAIQGALAQGILDSGHFSSYLKMKVELAGLKKKNDAQMRRGNKKPSKHAKKQASEPSRNNIYDI